MILCSIHLIVPFFVAQTLLLECKASRSGDHVVVDCQTNRPPVYVLCTFDDGPKPTCMLLVNVLS